MSYLSICKYITFFQYHFLYLCSGGIEFFVCIFCKNDAPLWKLFISFQNINIAALCHWFRYKIFILNFSILNLRLFFEREHDKLLSDAQKELKDLAVTATEKLVLQSDGDAFDQFLDAAERGKSHA